MNPRRPTPSGPQPDPSAPGPQPQATQVNQPAPSVLKQRLGIALSQRLLSEFLEWCRGRSSEETCRQYLRKLEEIDRGERPVEASRWHVTAYKRFSRWLCEERGLSRACEEFKRVKSRRSRPDVYVPGESEVRAALDSSLGWWYRLLLESGLRASELARVVGEASRLRWVCTEAFCRAELNWHRGSKRVFWAYFLERPEERPVDLRRLEEAREALGLIGFKYIRKYVATKMLELGIPEEVVNYIQGRVPQEVLSKHYLKLTALADQYYKEYAEWLRGWLP